MNQRHALSIVLSACMAVSALLGVASGASADDSACPTVDGPRCTQLLSTGITTAYVEVGPSDAPVLILLHGLTDSARSWSRAMADLHAQRPDLHIIALDQRGHGKSSVPVGPTCASQPETCYTMPQFAADVIAFMDAKGIAKASIAGHSMGSIVAQQVGLTYPDRVTALILIATTAKVTGNAVADDWLLQSIINGTWGKALKKRGIVWPSGAAALTPLDVDRKAVKWMQANWDVDPVAPVAFTAAIARETARVPLQTWIGATKGLLAYNETKALRSLKVPTLVLWGTQDSFFYKGDQDALVTSLTAASAGGGQFCWKQYGTRPLDASGYQLDDLGHNLQWEAPGQVAKDISAYLQTGRPTKILVHTKGPKQPTTVVSKVGKATVICSGTWPSP
jgi:pimeloyl-ACP methyl ester carboxylesterase